MPLCNLRIQPEAVCILESGVSKHEALDQLVSCVAATGAISDVEAFRQAVKEREAVMSTGIGSGVAIPHVRIDAVKHPTVGIGISKEGIDFGTLDNKPVNIIILFAMPTGSHKEYLGLLAQVMTIMKAPGFREQLAGCSEVSEVLDLVNRPD